MHIFTVITGQTATGKSSYALKLAKEQKVDIISADARHAYKQLDIVTGKDIPEGSEFVSVEPDFTLEDGRTCDIGYYVMNGVRVWGMDLVSPDVLFSSYDFASVVEHITQTHMKLSDKPILIGGSYLYIKHVIYGFDVRTQPDWDLRNELENLGVEELQNRLQAIDANIVQSMNHSDAHNPRRLIRKIEIAQSNNEKSAKHVPQEPRFHSFIGFRHKDTEKLNSVITKRVEERIQNGAIEECEKLMKEGYTLQSPGLNSIGYPQIFPYINKEKSLEEMKNDWITKEVQYAKRQLTFMKKDTNVEWKVASGRN